MAGTDAGLKPGATLKGKGFSGRAGNRANEMENRCHRVRNIGFWGFGLAGRINFLAVVRNTETTPAP
jgi:hypothetical protein